MSHSPVFNFNITMSPYYLPNAFSPWMFSFWRNLLKLCFAKFPWKQFHEKKLLNFSVKSILFYLVFTGWLILRCLFFFLIGESHQRQLLLFSDNSGKFLDSFSKEFETSFINQLKRAHGTKRTFANQVYQEYIKDKEHTHM